MYDHISRQPKILTEISTEDMKYLEEVAFGFPFPEKAEFEKARLIRGRDGAMCIQFKHIQNLDQYIEDKVKPNLEEIDSFERKKTNVNEKYVDGLIIVGEKGDRERQIFIYEESGVKCIELYSGFMDERIIKIFKALPYWTIICINKIGQGY